MAATVIPIQGKRNFERLENLQRNIREARRLLRLMLAKRKQIVAERKAEEMTK